jgi:hypothetical protein
MAAYSIQTDAGHRSLHIVMRGYWDQPTFDVFSREYEQAVRSMHTSGGLAKALVDGREFAVQAKEISEQFGALIARNLPFLAKHTATVVPAHLNKLQAERAGGELAAHYFTDIDEACAWLDWPGGAQTPG